MNADRPRARQPGGDAAGEALVRLGHPDSAKVLRAFVAGDRLVSIPRSLTKRLIVLDWLAQDFEPGRRYSEATVNEVLLRRHPDFAALRRYMVDEGLLDRRDGQYWRCGGTVPES